MEDHDCISHGDWHFASTHVNVKTLFSTRSSNDDGRDGEASHDNRPTAGKTMRANGAILCTQSRDASPSGSPASTSRCRVRSPYLLALRWTGARDGWVGHNSDSRKEEEEVTCQVESLLSCPWEVILEEVILEEVIL